MLSMNAMTHSSMATPSSTPPFGPQRAADAALKNPRFRAPHIWAYRGVSKESKQSKDSSALSSSPTSSLSSAKSSPHYMTSTKASANSSTSTPVSKIPIRTPLNSDLKPRSAGHDQLKRPKAVRHHPQAMKSLTNQDVGEQSQ